MVTRNGTVRQRHWPLHNLFQKTTMSTTNTVSAPVDTHSSKPEMLRIVQESSNLLIQLCCAVYSSHWGTFYLIVLKSGDVSHLTREIPQGEAITRMNSASSVDIRHRQALGSDTLPEINRELSSLRG